MTGMSHELLVYATAKYLIKYANTPAVIAGQVPPSLTMIYLPAKKKDADAIAPTAILRP